MGGSVGGLRDDFASQDEPLSNGCKSQHGCSVLVSPHSGYAVSVRFIQDVDEQIPVACIAGVHKRSIAGLA